MRELLFWLKLAALGSLLGLTVFFCVMRVSLRGGTVTMPDLRGLPRGSAEQKLRTLGLDMDVREERYSTTEPYGAVLEQNLEPGVTLKRGRTIAVVVSIGDKVLSVPQLTGSPSQRQAELILEQNGLALGRTATITSPDLAGTVLAQSPEAGQKVTRGEGVSLLVSAGPEPVSRLMPELRGRSLDDARALVGRMGLVLRRVLEGSAQGAAPGSVLAQSLSPSTRVAMDSELTLTVAPGGSAQVAARLATLSYTMPTDGFQERRLLIVVQDSLGQRPVYNRMLEPGATVNRDVLVHGPATAQISVAGNLVQSVNIP
ncbi:MAG TPA: PASTA domain-containing protein [bacterium]|nr:PASTA domain-containing protein [bacterium]